jgi:nuclear pore complex protein Nup205
MLEWEGGVLHPFRDFGQSHLRIIEFLQSINFHWFDSLSVKPLDLQLLKNLDLRSCLRTNADGCEIVDKNTLLSLLATARRAIHSQTTGVAPPLLEQLNAETAYILESCAVENHRREVRHAAGVGYGAWRRLVDMTLTKSNCGRREGEDDRVRNGCNRENVRMAVNREVEMRMRTPDEPTGWYSRLHDL